MDWENLKTFILVSDAKSLSEAARSLKISQPTLRRRISELENELGVELLVRTTAGFELTKGGMKVRQFGLAMKEKADALMGNVPTDIDSEEGSISLSGFPSFMIFHLARYVPDLLEAYPGLRINADIDNDVKDPFTGDVDIAIMYKKPDNPELITQRIGSIHYLLFGSKDYLAKHGEPTTHYGVMSHRRGINRYFLTNGQEREAGVINFARNIEWHFMCNSTEALASICAAGMGVCPLPSSAIYYDSRLKPIPVAPMVEIPIMLVYTERVKRLKRGQLVLDWIMSTINGDRGHHFESVLDVQRVINESNQLNLPQKR